jgi:hypothetical protein
MIIPRVPGGCVTDEPFREPAAVCLMDKFPDEVTKK